MSSKTKSWNKKPGQAGFGFPSKGEKEWRRYRHSQIKAKQRAHNKELGL